MDYPADLARRFAQQMADLFRRVRSLESRTAGIDSGMTLALLPAVIDPGYVSGDPMAYVNGSAILSGPYKRLDSYTPAASDAVVMLPVPLTAVTAQAGSYVILGELA